MKESVISLIAKNCQWRKTVNEIFSSVCEDRIDKLEKMLPSGSGIDSGCKINREKSGEDKVIIEFDFHHMDDNGYYDGWTHHEIIIKPKLWNNFDFRITGRNKRMIEDYLNDVFDYALREEIEL